MSDSGAEVTIVVCADCAQRTPLKDKEEEFKCIFCGSLNPHSRFRLSVEMGALVELPRIEE